MSDNISNKIDIIESKLNALISMIGNQQDSNFDALRIKDFIEKYSFIETILKSDTVNSMMDNISSLQQSIEETSENLKLPIAVIKEESNKLMDVYKNDTTELALNIADVKLLKNSLYIAFRDLLKKVSSYNIDEKIYELNEQIEFAKEIANNIKINQSKINDIIKKIEQEESIIKDIESKNEKQDRLIEYINTLTVEIEKQIEDYAFFSEEFNRLYMNAKVFVGEFSELYEKLKQQDIINESIQKNIYVLNQVFQNNYFDLNKHIETLSEEISNLTKTSLYMTTEGMLFANEVKSYIAPIREYVDKYKNIVDEQDNNEKILEGFLNELH